MAKVQVQVANTGFRTGSEVVQVYVSFPSGVTEEVPQPVPPPDPNDPATAEPEVPPPPLLEEIEFPTRVLRNFTKVELPAGERQTVEMTLNRKDLSYWSVRWQNWVMPDVGRFRIWVGRSSRDVQMVGGF